MLSPHTVAVYQTQRETRYPRTPPYHPDRAYPEYPFGERVSGEPNAAYEAVRGALHLLGLDKERYGTPDWNPLGEGLPSEGGDQFAEDTLKRKTEQRVVALTKRVLKNAGRFGARVGVLLKRVGIAVFGDTNRDAIRSGNWHGNDTIWRTVYDVLKCWMYADKSGVLQDAPQRRFFCIVDGLVAGEGNGPLAPKAKACGVCIAGCDPVAVDTTSASLIGFDPDKIRILRNADSARGFRISDVSREEIRCISNNAAWNGSLQEMRETLDFEPHFGWKGHIESPGRLGQTEPSSAS